MSVCVELMSTADENASQFKKCSLANIYLRGTGLMMISKNFSQKKCIHVYKYTEFSYQKLHFNDKNTLTLKLKVVA